MIIVSDLVAERAERAERAGRAERKAAKRKVKVPQVACG